MEKARRQMEERLKAVDMIIELRDARIPLASKNPMLAEMAPQKPRLVILTKTDMADPEETEKWIRSLTHDDILCIPLDLMKDKNVKNKIVRASAELMKEKHARMRRRGINPRATRAMAAGIPNVGKSTLINRISGKKTVKAEDRPGVTRSLTWIHVDPDLDILDTPGVLWPKFEDEKTGSLLAAIGSINDEILDRKMLAMDTISLIRRRYPGVLEERFESGDVNANGMLKAIAEKNRFLKENGVLDTKRSAEYFLHELRKGKLGRFTLESADEEDMPE
jgi:ribosome biogenesis GTPase A